MRKDWKYFYWPEADVEQLFNFTRFYANYYRTGPGKSHPYAAQRALTADRVRFNLETKILPPSSPGRQDPTLPSEMFENHTVTPQIFVDTLCGAITRAGMQARSNVQSFDFRTLILVEEQHPDIPTFYLIEDAHILSSDFVPISLRQLPHNVAPSKR